MLLAAGVMRTQAIVLALLPWLCSCADETSPANLDLSIQVSKACGPLTCVTGEACVESNNGAPPPDGGAPTMHACVVVPAACAAQPTCECLDGNGGSGAFCQKAAPGSIQCVRGNHGPDGAADLWCPGL
jgi:hypothetical protein